jgi:catechol 2,3-dioxygenase-like lactoylglutathione lyase family enzyme
VNASNSSTGGGAQLLGVRIRCDDPPRAARVFAALSGGEAVPVTEGYRLLIGTARVTLATAPPGSQGRGIEAIELAFPRPALRVPPSPVLANGIEIEIAESPGPGRTEAAVRLDHVAILVDDLNAAVPRWSAILGVQPGMVGPHPLGNSDAARFSLGERMIELMSPWKGAETPLRRRLEASGEGPLALALVAADLHAAVASVEAVGGVIIHQPPHVFVHPRSAGGVLVQLTPRLAH